jgi:hypothetical protein
VAVKLLVWFLLLMSNWPPLVHLAEEAAMPARLRSRHSTTSIYDSFWTHFCACFRSFRWCESNVPVLAEPIE